MAGPLVPHGMAGAEQCVLSYGAVSPIWAVRCGFDLGVPWQALEMGKDEGLAVPLDVWSSLPLIPPVKEYRSPPWIK